MAANGKAFVADRQYYINAIDIDTGIGAWTDTPVVGQNLTPDGTGLVQRFSSGNLVRTDFDKNVVWSTDCSLDTGPVAPMCNGNYVVCSDQDGLLSVLNVGSGAVQYRFQIARGYQMQPVNVDSNGDAYASTYDGYLIRIGNTNEPTPTPTPELAVGNWYSLY